MPKTAKFHADLRVTPMLANESLYVGIDVGKLEHVAGFVSNTLIKRHERFEACPVLKFEQSREGFRQLIDRIQGFCPLEQCYVLLEKTGHYHKALEQYLLELDISVYIMHVQERPKGMMKTDKRDALGLANHLYNQVEKGIQVADRKQLVRRAFPPTETQAAMMIAAIGTIANFENAAALKSYFGWAPKVSQTGKTFDRASLTLGGTRTMKQVMFLVVANAVRLDTEWAKLYKRLVPLKCSYSEKTRSYQGKLKVFGRIAGQIIEMIYALLKKDYEVVSKVPPGEEPPAPTLYDPALHQSHRQGNYLPLKSPHRPETIVLLAKPSS